MSKQKIDYKDRLRFAFGAALALTALPVMALHLSLSAFAYGPERPTFTGEKPADYVTFNSITNNPQVGDERNFVRIKEVGQANFVDSASIVPGKEYEVFTFFHNNASEIYNTAQHNHKGIARNVTMSTKLPATLKKGQAADITSTISASNAKPNSVWDHVTISSPQGDVALRYVPDSATIFSNGAVNGRKLPSKIFNEGALLGYSDMNGILPGCTSYAGYVTYRFKADYADFTVSKTVSESGKGNWVESQSAKPAGKVDFKIHYKNTGTIFQNNVNIKDVLPQGLKYVNGSTRLFTASLPNGKQLNDDLTTKGVNIGNYSWGAEATIIFTAQVIEEKQLACGANKLINRGQVHTENGAKEDIAEIVVQRNCSTTDFCQVIGKTHLKKNDPKCFEPCQIKGKEHLKKDDPKCFEHCIVKGKEHLKKDDPKCNDPCPVKGKEHLKANDPNCYQPCQIKGKENLKSTDSLCGEIPAELPKTGPMEAAMMIVAMTALSGAVAYWFRSREEMKKITNLGAKKEIKTPEITPKKDK